MTVKYQDESGNTLSDDVIFSGKVGEKYISDKKEVDGYTFKEVKGDASGTFTDQSQTVTYIHIKDPVQPNIEGTVITKYVDEDGKEISLQNVTSGTVGTAYTTEQKEVSGYTFKEVQGNATGNYTEGTTTVTYVYTKNDTVQPSVTTPTTSGINHANVNGTSTSENILSSTGENASAWVIILGVLIALSASVLVAFKRRKSSK